MRIQGIEITPAGHGHWRCSYEYRGRRLTRISSDSSLIDDAKEGKQYAIRWLKRFIRMGN